MTRKELIEQNNVLLKPKHVCNGVVSSAVDRGLLDTDIEPVEIFIKRTELFKYILGVKNIREIILDYVHFDHSLFRCRFRVQSVSDPNWLLWAPDTLLKLAESTTTHDILRLLVSMLESDSETADGQHVRCFFTTQVMEKLISAGASFDLIVSIARLFPNTVNNSILDAAASHNQFQCFIAFLEMFPGELKPTFNTFNCAIVSNDLDILEFLLVNQDRYPIKLFLAVGNAITYKKPKVVELLLKHKVEVNDRSVQAAIDSGNPQLVEALHTHCNQQITSERALISAAKTGNTNLIKLLYRKDLVKNDIQSILYSVVSSTNIEGFEFFLHDISKNTKCLKSLWHAVTSNPYDPTIGCSLEQYHNKQLEMMKYLKKHKYIRTFGFDTSSGNPFILKYLLDNNHLNLTALEIETILDNAIEHSNLPMIQYLYEESRVSVKILQGPSYYSILSTRVSKSKAHQKEYYRHTSEAKDLEIFKYLMKSKLNVNSQDLFNLSMLYKSFLLFLNYEFWSRGSSTFGLQWNQLVPATHYNLKELVQKLIPKQKPYIKAAQMKAISMGHLEIFTILFNDGGGLAVTFKSIAEYFKSDNIKLLDFLYVQCRQEFQEYVKSEKSLKLNDPVTSEYLLARFNPQSHSTSIDSEAIADISQVLFMESEYVASIYDMVEPPRFSQYAIDHAVDRGYMAQIFYIFEKYNVQIRFPQVSMLISASEYGYVELLKYLCTRIAIPVEKRFYQKIEKYNRSTGKSFEIFHQLLLNLKDQQIDNLGGPEKDIYGNVMKNFFDKTFYCVRK
ncbi:hypothetical protein PPL_04679 [Heterostelium album PN500]|uniref:Ankyrin repeat protein n=1 Tax=Heterostelium pallidum (strain ATCC 26659 / Pp 5 / PN500) TaxID=670386 RepID=D3B888_HETP5|nr:hypothetical protein PPL_04679 [Heterostelium album PN500]EFA82256.1 hypothetical protein PPL_04679 [Heterostelium album PN500]|eukprot:XP_020434373.1 hypothetical protein PPL_04679 [Heterostelium album PN500]